MPASAAPSADDPGGSETAKSTPVMSAVVKAEGIWIEDADGRRTMDFHGNSVHHIGYGHPRLKTAIAEQMDKLPFAPRRSGEGLARGDPPAAYSRMRSSRSSAR